LPENPNAGQSPESEGDPNATESSSSTNESPGRGGSTWRRLSLTGLIVYWAALFVSTHIPLPKSGSQVNDKTAHLVAYGLLAFLLAAVLSRKFRPLPLAALAMGVAATYGAVDELLQLLVSSRTADVSDWLADVTGAAIGTAVFLAGRFCVRRLTLAGSKRDG